MSYLNTIACFVLIFISFISTVKSYKISDEHDVVMYLNRFGYVNDEDVTDKMETDTSMLKPMLMKFQKMCGINRTGLLDSKTMEMMNAPRCGNLDINQTEHHTMFMKEMGMIPDENDRETFLRRYRRFAINEQNFSWKKRELTYKMAMFSETMRSHVTEDIALQEVHQAFKLWSEVTNLDFIYRPKDKKVDIELSFTMRFHVQDQYPFDGPGKTLAHAFPPGEGLLGDVHFEDEEDWTVKTPKGINVLFVATHEIGHALGLSHSSTKGAIMQPFYGGYKPKLQLHADDIAGIQALYGIRERRTDKNKPTSVPTKPPAPSTTTTPRHTPSAIPPRRTTVATERYPENGGGSISPLRPDLCKDSSIDAITTVKDGSVYAFKGNYVFQIDGKGKGILPGWPHRIETIFRGLESNLDAAVTRKNGKTYFFKGPYYWRFVGTQIDPGYPKKLSQHFSGIPDKIDSAFEWLGAIYFTKGSKVWRFDPMSKPFVSDKYPISLDLWQLNAPGIDAAFKAPNGHIYFFSGQTYWRFDERKFRVDKELNPPYPRSSKSYWFGCAGDRVKVDYREIRQLMPYKNYNKKDYFTYDYYY